MEEFKVQVDAGVEIHRVTGELELADCDRHPNIRPTCEVDVVLIGTAGQVEMLLNRLNNGYEGWVDSKRITHLQSEPFND